MYMTTCINSTWQLPGSCLTTTWQLTCQLTENYLTTDCIMIDCLLTACWLPADCLPTACQLPANCQLTTQQLSDNCMLTACLACLRSHYFMYEFTIATFFAGKHEMWNDDVCMHTKWTAIAFTQLLCFVLKVKSLELRYCLGKCSFLFVLIFVKNNAKHSDCF